MSDCKTFYAARDDRTHRYAGRVLDPTQHLAITVERQYLETVHGQAATIVTANLLSRMSRSVALAFPDRPIQVPLTNYVGKSLHRYILTEMRGADRFGSFNVRKCEEADYRIHLGRDGAEWIAHGSDWNAFIGAPPSPLPPAETLNVFGAAFASIMAIAKIFAGCFPGHVAKAAANLLRWNTTPSDVGPDFRRREPIGNVWFIGGGSVGSAVAYFLTLAGLSFEATIFDGDIVEIENLDRSPIFRWSDEGEWKAKVIARFLRAYGIRAHAEPTWLDKSPVWMSRQQGEPDLLVSAANERNVRYAIETWLPPVQIYGTTGANWQASVLRHIPPQDPCSCCMFPPGAPAATKCATASGISTNSSSSSEQIDASLPFLSFAAGLMAAVEIAKLTIPGELGPNRAFFTPCAEPIVFSAGMAFRDDCVCRDRSSNAHQAMVSGSKYTDFSRF